MTPQRVNGLGMLIRQAALDADAQELIAFGSSGKVYKEASGTLEEIGDITTDDLLMEMTSAYDRAYMAFSNLVTSTGVTPRQYLRYQNQFYFDALGIAPAEVADVRTALTAGMGATAGDVPTGIFYLTVLFVTRSGYLSGIAANAMLYVHSTEEGRQLVVDNIPLGPANCVARILCFTEPGMSSAGPYYYLAESFEIEGLNAMITSTVIEDNTTTMVNVNFTLDALRAGTDVTQFFDKMLVPAVVGARFLPSLRRIAYWGNKDEPSTVFMSEPDDPETLYATRSRINIAENNGQRIESVFEFRSEVYVAKERGAHVLDPTNTYPSTWSVHERWSGVGPCGPRALDVCEEFVVFAHRSGAYLYDGGKPQWLSWEHSGDSGLWKRINWAQAHLMSVKIDTETKRVFFCVPMDQSEVPDKILVLDYSLGFDAEGRRWSVYNIPAMQVIRAERVVPADANPDTPDDNAQLQSQLLLASSDGAINMLDADSHLDNGKGIHAHYQFAYFQPGGIIQLGGLEVSVMGAGQLALTQLSDEDEASERQPVAIVNGKHKLYVRKTRGSADMWSLRLAAASDGDWFDCDGAALWLNVLWPWTR